jgi:hypothetical protein
LKYTTFEHFIEEIDIKDKNAHCALHAAQGPLQVHAQGTVLRTDDFVFEVGIRITDGGCGWKDEYSMEQSMKKMRKMFTKFLWRTQLTEEEQADQVFGQPCLWRV